MDHGKDEVRWSAVEDGFYVASASGMLLGFVDRISDNVYQACDSGSRLLGVYTSLHEARAAVVREDYRDKSGLDRKHGRG